MDADDYKPEFEFSAPPSSSAVENTFRMAQVLQKRKDYTQALEKYHLVCDTVEREVTMSHSSATEVHWAVFSLRSIADIYSELQDWDKSLAFRSVEKSFLEFLQRRQSTDPSTSEPPETDFLTATSNANFFSQLFSQIHAARELPETQPPDCPEALMKRLEDARVRDDEENAERVIQLLNDATEERERQTHESFWKRNLKRISDHPVQVIAAVLLFGAVALLVTRIGVPRKPRSVGGARSNFASRFGEMDNVMKSMRDDVGGGPRRAEATMRTGAKRRAVRKEAVYDL
jgi:hypothetical protein